MLTFFKAKEIWCAPHILRHTSASHLAHICEEKRFIPLANYRGCCLCWLKNMGWMPSLGKGTHCIRAHPINGRCSRTISCWHQPERLVQWGPELQPPIQGANRHQGWQQAQPELCGECGEKFNVTYTCMQTKSGTRSSDEVYLRQGQMSTHAHTCKHTPHTCLQTQANTIRGSPST